MNTEQDFLNRAAPHRSLAAIFTERGRGEVVEMFRFLFKSSFQLNRSENTRGLPLSSLKCFSTVADHLVHSHGFSQEEALRVSNLIRPRSAEAFDSVLTLLKDYGFSPTVITNMVSRSPSFLSARAYEVIKPKLDFLSEKGITNEVLLHLVSNNAHLMAHSLKNQIIPAVNCLIDLLGIENVKSMFMVKRGGWCLRTFNGEYESNIRTLKSIGVPDKHIMKMLIIRPMTLCRASSSFRDTVDQVRQMGLDPSSLMFIHGVCCMLGTDHVKWAAKMAAFEKFGWSRDDIVALFVKQPQVMRSCAARIEKNLSFFMNELGWTVLDICTYPTTLLSSYEKKTLPRSIVFRFLLSKNLVRKKSMGTALLIPEDNFLEKYLMAYREKLPQILEMYQNAKTIVEVPSKSRAGKEQC